MQDKDGRPRCTHSYAALSYTWGQPRTVFFAERVPYDSGIPFFIYCDGTRIAATENCYKGLMYLGMFAGLDCVNQTPAVTSELTVREPYQGSRYIWIDSICINQHDNQEKAVQVSMMSRIYRQAQAVYIWLGKHDEFTRPAISVLFDWPAGAAQAERPILLGNTRLSEKKHTESWGLRPSLRPSGWQPTPSSTARCSAARGLCKRSRSRVEPSSSAGPSPATGTP